ncbi:response regulator [Salibacter halophilus]|jgi:response regulator RpfG family c-di-GMP phosphodiesterase|uniref:Response regulator n=1 Tax=Salibacter halophilus TaxID=1803916 RepID=A0A6N6M9W4_9FLAO|nr:response regulator [Salibacter halophilus]KAB1065040.1 response regulator [Salibacter halophilus]
MTDGNKEKEKIHVLYVDDEEHNLVSFKASFRRSFKIWTAISANEAREVLEKEEIHIIITDQRMPDETGVEFLVSILDKHPEPIRMLLTGYSDIEAVIDSINKGQVYRYITKPWNDKQLELSIKNAHEVYSLRKENKILFEKLKKANEQLEFLLRQKLLD